MGSCSDNHLLKRTFLMFLLVSTMVLKGCTNSSIYNDPDYNPPVYFGTHVVREGDTMYSIAWRYGRDFKELATANSIAPPYKIFVGQKIRLDLKATSQQVESNSLVTKAKPKATKNNKQTNVNKGKIAPKNSSKNVDSVIRWRWPHLGPVIAEFSVTGEINNGVDIAGKVGEPIYAAADGEVVYAGSGLLGYGKLLIINHNESYLSAYAHNHEILVKEGQKIKKGTQIATLGSTGTNRAKLHFEIRKNGNPVDPLRYLPKRH
ncbi:MAG: peptidoglycan DD-metalloendopeptidase family protein [Hahellaceae bacterium]|nr:peptidoglycan DD-metalloendopeptidase family protein [Hahellaceae bacterium]MCP5213189.1 peptidoglycan DD-metalloendopeptidase family protein [Hahellaceae bacterium]